MAKPPPKQSPDAIIVLRGPERSTHLPNTAADTPRNAMAMLKIHASCVWFQSCPDSDLVTPMILVSGSLNTLNAYTCPMARWMASAAGGTSQRL